MLEATCGKCDETFNPDGDTDMEHAMTSKGRPCGGTGELTDRQSLTGRQAEATPVHLINPEALFAIDHLDAIRRSPGNRDAMLTVTREWPNHLDVMRGYPDLPVKFSPTLASVYAKLTSAYKCQGEFATALSLTDGEREAFAAALTVGEGLPLFPNRSVAGVSARRSLSAKLSSVETAAAPVEDYRQGAARAQGLTALEARLTREEIPHTTEDIGAAKMAVNVLLPGREEYLLVERCELWNSDPEHPDGWKIFEYIPEDDDFDEVGSRLTMVAALAIIRSMRQEG